MEFKAALGDQLAWGLSLHGRGRPPEHHQQAAKFVFVQSAGRPRHAQGQDGLIKACSRTSSRGALGPRGGRQGRHRGRPRVAPQAATGAPGQRLRVRPGVSPPRSDSSTVDAHFSELLRWMKRKALKRSERWRSQRTPAAPRAVRSFILNILGEIIERSQYGGSVWSIERAGAKKKEKWVYQRGERESTRHTNGQYTDTCDNTR